MMGSKKMIITLMAVVGIPMDSDHKLMR